MSYFGRILHSISIVTMVIGTVLIIVGFAAPYWRVSTISSSVKVSMGLWQYCQPTCDPIQDPPKNLYFVRYPAIVCMIVSISTWMTAFYFKLSGLEKYYIRKCTNSFLAGGLGIAVGALFIHFFPESAADGLEYGWAFMLFFAGSVIMMLTSFLTCFAGILDRDDD